MLEFESIMDAPRETLDPTVWRETGDGKPTLTDEALGKVTAVLDYVRKEFGLDEITARITGSITSNQWSEDSDIDVHISFDGLTDDNQESMNKLLREGFVQRFGEGYGIGRHPIELYFQPNPFQDLMSVGCYDVLKGEWLVGPDMKPLDFDPYSEFYSEDMEYVKSVVKDIRNIILECYETALVIQNSKDGAFRDGQWQELEGKLERAVAIFDSAKQCRKVYSSPTSAEDAFRKRESRKWKIADSSFKLLDKFGYLKILKKFSKILESSEDGDLDAISDAVVRSVRSSMNLNETVDESVKGMGMYFILASILALPGIIPQKALADNLSKVGKTQLRIQSPKVQDAIKDSAKDKRKFGRHTVSDIVNMAARTLYAEARGEGTNGLNAVASVILNRSAGNPEDMVSVIKEKQAFSCWNGTDESFWRSYVYTVPNGAVQNPEDRRVWNDCVRIATELVEGKFKSTIGRRNSYLNPKTASSKAVSSWGKKLDLEVGKHKFGYLPEHDPKYVLPGTMTPRTDVKDQGKDSKTEHVVQKGDTLWDISKATGKSVEDILKKNPGLNPKNLKIGQKISL